MCVVSYVGDIFKTDIWPAIKPPKWDDYQEKLITLDKKEFEALKKEVEELKKLLMAAKNYDKATGQKDCEMGDKVSLIKKIAEIVGVNLEDIFENKN